MKYCLLVLLCGFILITVYSLYLAISKMNQLNCYRKVENGMDTNKMLNIMGKGYRAEKDDDKEIYIWEANASKNYTGVTKIRIATKDNKVVSVQAIK